LSILDHLVFLRLKEIVNFELWHINEFLDSSQRGKHLKSIVDNLWQSIHWASNFVKKDQDGEGCGKINSIS